jgi:hypothetical protein
MLKHIVFALSALAFGAAGLAKLPDPTPEQKAAAALASAKSAHAAKVDSYKLCLVQSKIADAYGNQQKAQGKAYAPEATPACADPGPFVAPTAAATTPTGMTPAGTTQAAPAPAAKPAAAPAKK